MRTLLLLIAFITLAECATHDDRAERVRSACIRASHAHSHAMNHLYDGRISKKQFKEIDYAYKEILFSCHGALTSGYPDDYQTLNAVNAFNAEHGNGY